MTRLAATLALTVISERPLAAAPRPATNVRFATPTSVFLSRLHDGVTLTGYVQAAAAEEEHPLLRSPSTLGGSPARKSWMYECK